MRLRKLLSLILSAALTLQVSAVPALAAAPTGQNPFSALNSPSNIATLVSSSGSQGLPQVILIQDLHFNYSVQRNIAKLLEFLNEKGVVGPSIAVEGATGPVDDHLITQIQSRTVRSEIADFLMQNGELTGAQYFADLSGQSRLQGVEDRAYFDANVNLFRTSYEARQEALAQVSHLRERLETLVPRVCGGSAAHRLKKLRTQYEGGELSLAAFDRAALALAKTPEAENLIRLLGEFSLAERALGQHSTLEEIRHVAARLESTASLVQLLSAGGNRAFEMDLAQVKEALRACVDFYVAALMRNKPLLENTLKLVPRNTSAHKSTVLVVGGFHTRYLSQELTKRGVSFAVFAPQVERHSEEDQALYDARLLGGTLTESEALSWLAAHGGIRGSPVKSDGALALVPDPSQLPWLPSWIQTSQKNHSFYNGKVYAALKEKYDVRFDDRFNVKLNELESEFFDRDDLLPGGKELRGVLSLLQQAGIQMPIDRLAILVGEQVHLTPIGKKAISTLRPLSLDERAKLLELRETKPNLYTLYAHQDAIHKHAGFINDPFVFWLVVMLHEIAHTKGHRHAAMEALGLDWQYTPNLSAQAVVKKFAALLPDEAAKLLDGSGVESILAISGPAYRRMRAKKLKNLADLNPSDIGQVSDFSIQTGLEPGRDYKPAEKIDFKTLPKTIDDREIANAILLESDGLVVEEIFAGGAATRIRSLLDMMVTLGLRTPHQAKLLWNSKIRDFPKAMTAILREIEVGFDEVKRKPMDQAWKIINLELNKYRPDLTIEQVNQLEDWGHWGARAMLSLNAHVRRVARASAQNEQEALKKKRILFHVSESDLEAMASDFDLHRLYGFGEILFVVNKPGPYIVADRTKESFVLVDPRQRVRYDSKDVPVGDIVYGHGPATLALNRPGATYVLRPGQDLVPLTLPDDPEPVSASQYLLHEFSGSDVWVIREHRLNDLGLLDMGKQDIEELAYFNQLRQDPHHPAYTLFRMVANPAQVNVSTKDGDDGKMISVDTPIQAGGQSYVFMDNEGKKLVVPVETGATGGVTSDYVSKFKQIGGHPASDYLNAMRTLKSGKHWLQALSSEGLTYFYGVHKFPGQMEPARLTSDGGILLKPQLATGHLALSPTLGAQAFVVPSDNPNELFPGLLTDLKTPDLLQTLRSIAFADKQNSDPLVLALAKIQGFAVEPAKYGPELKGKIEEEEKKIQLAKQPEASLRPRHAHAFALAAAIPIIIGLTLFQPLALAAAPWGIAALGQEYALLKQGSLTKNPIAIYNENQSITWYGTASIPARAEELAHALTQSRSEVVTRLIAPLTLVLAAVDSAVGGVLHMLNWMASVLNKSPVPDAAMLHALRDAAKPIGEALAAPDLPQFPAASGFWLRVKTGMLAVYKNSRTREETAELAARAEIAGAA